MPNYKKYPKYKESGVEWLGKIPEGWNMSNLKYIANINMGQSPSSSTYNDKGIGIEFLQGNADFGNINPTARTFTTEAKKVSNINDILFTVRAPVGAMNISDKKYAIGRGLCAISSTQYSSKSFLWWLMPVVKMELDTVATGSTYEAVSVEQVNNSTVSLPPLQEQQTIANYLDIATAKIDTLIEKQTKLIALLKEKRQAVISIAVTRGLDSTVTMKDSGIEWLGEIPEAWEVKKLKYSARIQGGKDQKAVLDDNGEYPVYGSGGIFGYANQYLYDGESVLLGRKGTVDKPLYVNDKFWTVDTMYYTIVGKHTIPKWLYYMATTIHFDYYQYGSAVPSMTQEDLHNIYFSTPAKEEQQKIVNYLDDKTSKIDKLVSKSTKAIDLLKEKRTALISSAVTGKIDVREIA